MTIAAVLDIELDPRRYFYRRVSLPLSFPSRAIFSSFFLRDEAQIQQTARRRGIAESRGALSTRVSPRRVKAESGAAVLRATATKYYRTNAMARSAVANE